MRAGSRIVATVLVALLAAACARGPAPPLYLPRVGTGTYGYFEQQLAANRYRVGYSAPLESGASYSAAERRRAADRLIALSYDLALLRAAQLAIAHGATTFSTAERENNVQVDVRPDYYYGDPFYPFPYRARRFGWYPWAPFPYAPPYSYGSQTEIAVEVAMTVTLGGAAGADSFVARDTRDALLAKYPDAAGTAATASVPN